MKKAIILILLSTAIVLLSTGFVLSYTIHNNEKIHKNVYIENVHVGGLSKSEAINHLNNIYKVSTIGFVHDDKIWNLNLKDIGFKYKIEEAVDEAYGTCKDGNFFQNVGSMVKLNSGNNKVIDLKVEYSKDEVDDYISKLESDINVVPTDANIKINGGNIDISKENMGYHVDTDKLRDMVNNNLQKEIFDNIVIPTQIDEPIVKYEELSKINALLGEYSTKFNASVPGRSENIRLCAKQINGSLILPNEEFSFNETTGRRGLSQGYQKAPVIVQGELQEGIGGGVCQVSSTLFNTALYAGVDITSRRNHSIASSYVPKGRDATVDYGNIDFKFANNYDSPVYIECYTSGNIIVSKIYGNIADKKNISIETINTENIPRQIVYENDSSLPVGSEKVKENGRDGLKVETYRIIHSNGEDQRQLITKSYYPPKKQVILKGTKLANQKIIPKQSESINDLPEKV